MAVEWCSTVQKCLQLRTCWSCLDQGHSLPGAACIQWLSESIKIFSSRQDNIICSRACLLCCLNLWEGLYKQFGCSPVPNPASSPHPHPPPFIFHRIWSLVNVLNAKIIPEPSSYLILVFIVAKSTWLKIYYVGHVEEYSTVVLTICMLLNNWSLELFHQNLLLEKPIWGNTFFTNLNPFQMFWSVTLLSQ